MDSVRAVQAALDGGELDIDALERLAFSPVDAREARDEVILLLLRLVAEQPEQGVNIPEAVFPALLRGLSLSEALQLTGISAESLHNPVVRPVLLGELVDKAATATDAEEPLFAAAFALLADGELDTPSVAAIERLVDAVPELAARHAPFDALFTGSAVLKARSIAVNTRLVQRRVFPASRLNRLMWIPLEPESGDVLLAAIQIDYVGDLVRQFKAQPAIRPYVGQAVHELCGRYTTETQFAAAIESVLARLAEVAEVVFLELDAQYSLVTHERPNLLAVLPPRYIVEHHSVAVERLEITHDTLYAAANIAQSPTGLDLLRVSEARLTSMPLLQQLVFATAASTTDRGMHALAQRFPQVVKNAASAPATEEMRDLLATFKRNMLRSIPRMRGDAQVAVDNA